MRKTLSFATIVFTAVLSLAAISARAEENQNDVVNLKKYVEGPDANGQYQITLETYATGKSVKTESTIVPPVNIILLIDVSKAMWTNQQPVPLSEAVKDFIDTYPEPTDPSESHHITVITFDNQVKDVWQNVSKSQTTTIKNAIVDYGTSGTLFSQPEYAFERAIAEAQSFAADSQASKNQTMVLFFTSTTRQESGELDWYAVSSQSTVNLAYVLKHDGPLPDGHKSVTMYSNRIDKKGTGGGKVVKTLTYTNGLNCKVFSIANFKQTKSASEGEENNVKHYLNFVSSLYPDKWVSSDSEFNTTSGDGTEEPNTTPYHQYNPDPTQIGEMFKKVQEEIKKPEIPINETSVVKDILTPDFKLPDGINLTNVKDYVKVYTQECEYSGAPSYTYSFNSTRTDITASVTVGLGDDRTINVSGYNFADHYCGYDEKNGVKTPHAGGQKLVITIPIEPVEDYQGGYYLPTNTSDSGIYADDQPIGKYEIPHLNFPSIGIIKKGLAVGESATFTVKRTKGSTAEGVDDKYNVILTNDGSGVVPHAILKDIPEGTYEITETDWSWTYGVHRIGIYSKDSKQFIYETKTVATQVLDDDMVSSWSEHGITESAQCVLIVFENKKSSTPATEGYAEAVAKNKFIKPGASSGNSSETINSKAQPK